MAAQCFCKDFNLCFISFLQIKQGLDNMGEKVEAQCFCRDCNLCLCIISTDKTRVR